MTVPRAASFAPAVLPFSPAEAKASPLRALTSGLARGDDDAWAQFHRDYGPGIFRHLLAATHCDHDLATEALQQTYLRIARHARPCDEPAMFAGWLRIVTRSALHDCLRRRRSFWNLLTRRHADPTESAATADAEDDRLHHFLDQALEQLNPADRALLEAKYFSGADVRAIAEKLSTSPKAIESRLTRARAELRRHTCSPPFRAMTEKSTRHAQLLADTLHEDWTHGPMARHAREAAALARQRRRHRHGLHALGAVASIAAVLTLGFVFRTPPPPASPHASYEIMSDDELLAQLPDQPLLLLPHRDGTREIVLLEN